MFCWVIVWSICNKLNEAHKKVTTLINAGLKTTKHRLFGNPALSKYWTEHIMGYFDPVDWVKRFDPLCWVV